MRSRDVEKIAGPYDRTDREKGGGGFGKQPLRSLVWRSDEMMDGN